MKNRGEKAWWLILLIITPTAALFPAFFGVAYPSPEAKFTDLLVSHYPNALYLKRTILEDHILPLWSNTILSGYPFAANPLSGFWYIPGWLALIFPLPMGFSLVLLLHLAWGGLGMFTYLRREGNRWAAALAGGVLFTLLPKLYAHLGAGHISLLYGVCWTPWLLAVKEHDRAGIKSGLILGAIFLADPRWAVYAGLVWFAAKIAYRQYERRGKWKEIALTGLIAGLTASPLAVPLLQYTRQTTRIYMTAPEILTDSLPPSGVLGLLFPTSGANPEHYFYAGGLVLIFAVVGAVNAEKVRLRYWLWAAGISLVLACGSNIPGTRLLAQLPGFNLLRVPSRALFITSLAVLILAVTGLEDIFNGVLIKKRTKLITAAVLSFEWVLIAGLFWLQGKVPPQMLWGAGFTTAGAVMVLFSGRIKQKGVMFSVLVFLLLIDPLGTDIMSYHVRPYRDVFSRQEEWFEWVEEEYQGERIYSPSYSVPQFASAGRGWEMVNGVDPLQLQVYADFLDEASGIPREGYSITLPPYEGEDYAQANRGYSPRADLLGLLNTRWIVSAFPMKEEAFQLLGNTPSVYVYENLEVYPRVWMAQNSSQSGQDYPDLDTRLTGKAEIVEHGPNRIEIIASGRGRLILSEISYPGWQVRVDGQKRNLLTVGIFRAVDLEAGDHHVVFQFKPFSVYLGLGLGLAGIGIALCMAFRGKENE